MLFANTGRPTLFTLYTRVRGPCWCTIDTARQHRRVDGSCSWTTLCRPWIRPRHESGYELFRQDRGRWPVDPTWWV